MQELTFEQVEVVSGGNRIRGILEAIGGAYIVRDALNGLDDLSEEFLDEAEDWADSWEDQNCGNKDIYECAEDARERDSSGML